MESKQLKNELTIYACNERGIIVKIRVNTLDMNGTRAYKLFDDNSVQYIDSDWFYCFSLEDAKRMSLLIEIDSIKHGIRESEESTAEQKKLLEEKQAQLESINNQTANDSDVIDLIKKNNED